MIQIYNWILKQIFYFQYLVLKQEYPIPLKQDVYFESNSFFDGQFNKRLPWWDTQKWNTIDYNTYGHFKQEYGKFYFKAKLGKYIIRQPYFSDIWPAIWLTDMCSWDDVIRERKGHPYFYEIDAELFKTHFSYTIHWNHTGNQDKSDPNYHIVRSNFGSHKLYRNLQKDYHLFLIDWNEKWIKFFINGILTARFKNEIHVPMQIIMSQCEMSKVIIQK